MLGVWISRRGVFDACRNRLFRGQANARTNGLSGGFHALVIKRFRPWQHGNHSSSPAEVAEKFPVAVHGRPDSGKVRLSVRSFSAPERRRSGFGPAFAECQRWGSAAIARREERTPTEAQRKPESIENGPFDPLQELVVFLGRPVRAKVLGQVGHDGLELFIGSLCASGGHFIDGLVPFLLSPPLAADAG